MLIIQIAGGLGNQMQQYAVYTKLRGMGKDVRLDLSWFDPSVQKNMLAPREFELSMFEGVDYTECTAEERDSFLKQGMIANVTGKMLKKLGLRDEANPKVFSEKEMYHPEIFELEDRYIKGYFACQKYYDDIMGELWEKYTFPAHSDPDLHTRNMALVERMEKETSVSVHIRRGDYLDPSNVEILGNIATEEYYQGAMDYFSVKDPDTHFYIFTSDHEYAREKFSDESKYTIVDWNSGRNSVQDLMLMSHCKGNICANSTFSFWGARLNRRPDKTVIRTYKMRNNQPVNPDIMHDYWKGWILMDEKGSII
ncbi:alpha-1,2-fucosyltransferase [Butyrivibrio sp. XPD2006]|uniref:alpha-1,2-fucosyltransferase n=1 Tax=Butyrivibrio sp. XPD2006 TaxID=1280668 RepID=UPI0003B78808|nr:alpha-1,2-fucosyltransferase [Butyrivibrio sp. XPD2006]